MGPHDSRGIFIWGVGVKRAREKPPETSAGFSRTPTIFATFYFESLDPCATKSQESAFVTIYPRRE